MDAQEFYKKYWKVNGESVRFDGSDYWNAIQQAMDEGKELILSKRRTRIFEDKLWENTRILDILNEGKSVCFLTQNIEKSVAEFKYWTKHELFYKEVSKNQYLVSIRSFS